MSCRTSSTACASSRSSARPTLEAARACAMWPGPCSVARGHRRTPPCMPGPRGWARGGSVSSLAECPAPSWSAHYSRRLVGAGLAKSRPSFRNALPLTLDVIGPRSDGSASSLWLTCSPSPPPSPSPTMIDRSALGLASPRHLSSGSCCRPRSAPDFRARRLDLVIPGFEMLSDPHHLAEVHRAQRIRDRHLALRADRSTPR